MNLSEEEQGLIVEYVDGKPSDSEIKAVQNLLKENEEARELESRLRSTRLALIQEHQSSENQEVIKNLSELVKSRSKKTNSRFFGLFELKTNLGFSFNQVGGGALAGVAFSTAFAFFMVPTLFMPTDSTGNWNDYGFVDGEQVRMSKLTFRGTEDSLETSIKMTLAKMVEEKNINGTLADGEDLYEITISEVYENTQCFEGTMDLDEVRKEFIFCDGSEKKLDIK